MDETSPTPQDPTYAPHAQRPGSRQSATPGSDGRDDELVRLHARVAELQRERDHLVAIVDILQEISSSLHFVDILQAIARKLGDAFGLDRASIFLSGEKDEVRLVASYEDPAIRNLVVDLNRYPELKRAFDSGDTVFIPDASADPDLKSIKDKLDSRNVRSIIVLPIRWQSSTIGAIFLRTDRDSQPFSESDIRFCQVVASLTAKALLNAHRLEAVMRDQKDTLAAQKRGDLQRIALISFFRKLLDRYASSYDQAWAESLLPKASSEELDRLVGVAMQVIDEESKG